MVYTIPAQNMTKLEQLIEKMNRKIEKNNLEIEKISIHIDEMIEDENTVSYVCSINTPIIRKDDYRVVAVIDFEEAGEIIKQIDTSVEIPQKYYSLGNVCEHCHSHRNRKQAFIVYSENTGEFKQIGKSCVKLYCGINTEYLVSLCETVKMLEDASCESWGNAGCYNYYSVDRMGAIASILIHKLGYIKQNTAYLTRVFYDKIYKNDVMKFEEKLISELLATMNLSLDAFTDHMIEFRAYLSDVREWLDAQDSSNGYIHNLKVVMGNNDNFFNIKYIGLFVSMFYSYNRYVEKKQRESQRARQLADQKAVDAQSQFIGDVKQRMTFKIMSVKTLTSWCSSYSYYDDKVTRLIKMTDVDGNILIWKCSSNVDLESLDAGFSLKGTIKEHQEYKGIKQTVITRCKVVA